MVTRSTTTYLVHVSVFYIFSTVLSVQYCCSSSSSLMTPTDGNPNELIIPIICTYSCGLCNLDSCFLFVFVCVCLTIFEAPSNDTCKNTINTPVMSATLGQNHSIEQILTQHNTVLTTGTNKIGTVGSR